MNASKISAHSCSEKDLLDYTLRELLQMNSAKVSKCGDNICIQYVGNKGSIKANIATYSNNVENIDQPFGHNNDNQKMFEAEVIKRLNEGLTQSNVALIMGISQSRVSQIKNKHKERR